MDAILEILHNDHISFDKLLNFLEGQLHLLEDCEVSDLSTTLDAVRYMKEYPDYVHHPLEDTIFKYFLEHYEPEYEQIRDLLREHDHLPVLTDRLFEALQNALTGVPQRREELCTMLGEYISKQRQHIDHEEAHVYPVINAKLNEKDWQQIGAMTSRLEDPLFGKKVHKSYQRLFQQIISQ